MQTNSFRLLLLTGLLAGFALRLFRLGAESLWYDETVSVVLAQKTLPALIAHTAGDIHPPGYYILLHGWQWLTHPTPVHGLEFLYGWPSLFFGLLLLVLIFALGRRLWHAQTALLALWLTAINPFHIWYSQEVRMYTLGATLGLVALWALLQYFDVGANNLPGREKHLPGRKEVVRPHTRPKSTDAGRLQATTPDAAPSGKVFSLPGRLAWLNRSIFPEGSSGKRWLILYAVAGALGLYTLYYFLFLLVALNLIALILLIEKMQSNRRAGWPQLWAWIGAQGLLLLLWSPWLPTFWRQATDPPVPPWRIEWQNGDKFLESVNESLSALLIGQSLPSGVTWPWALFTIVLLLFALFLYKKQTQGKLILTLYLFVPILCIYAITYFLTPLYHVRYLFTYAPPFMLFVACALEALKRQQRWIGLLTTGALLAANGWSLTHFWFDPMYRADDHRAAVAQLAQAWRPGDLILVNAGWAYTALEVYWPRELIGPNGALPPDIARFVRIRDYANELRQHQESSNPAVPITAPIVVRSGSVDGADSLGWGDPNSDFFAVGSLQTAESLLAIGNQHPRIWQYRLYDTVSDPNGMMRKWLEVNAVLEFDWLAPGRDYLRLQRFVSKRSSQPYAMLLSENRRLQIGDGLQLAAFDLTPEMAAGATLYLRSRWLALPNVQRLPAQVSLSLRLYSADGHLYAQQDETPLAPINGWQPGEEHDLLLALPLPVAAKPGSYQAELILYDQSTGQPLPVSSASASGRAALDLGNVQLLSAQRIPEIVETIARFDYIDLVTIHLAQNGLAPNETLDLELIWRPRPNAYQDTYAATIELHDVNNQVVQSWSEALGGWDYPSGTWPTDIPVREWRHLPLDATIAAGNYQVTLRVTRASDGLPIPAKTGWLSLGGTEPFIPIGSLTVEGGR